MPRGPDLHGLFSNPSKKREEVLSPLTDTQIELVYRKANGIEKEEELKEDVKRLRDAALQLERTSKYLEGLNDERLRKSVLKRLSSEVTTMRSAADRKVKQVQRILAIRRGEDPNAPVTNGGEYRGGHINGNGKSIHEHG